MVREARKCVPTILWNETGLEKLGVHQPDSNNADAVAKYIEREKLDAVSKFHSAFTDSGRRYLWKLLEVIPLVGSVETWGYRFKFLRRYVPFANSMESELTVTPSPSSVRIGGAPERSKNQPLSSQLRFIHQ